MCYQKLIILSISLCSYLWLKSDRLGGKKELLSGMQYKQEEGRLIFKSLEVAHNGFYICQPGLDAFLTSHEVQVTVAMPGGKDPHIMYMYIYMYM